MTGASGFVGGHLLRLLEPERFDVYHLVRNRKGFPRESVWDFCQALPKDIPSCDVVVHLAAQIDFSRSLDPALYLVNTISTARLAKYCLDAGASLIVASTTAVHGSAPAISDEARIAPENDYALSKFLGEQIAQILAPSVTILRICGIYGLDGPTHLGLNTTISEAVHRQAAPVLRGAGRAKRNYICVTDVAKWIYHLMRREMDCTSSTGKDPACQLFYLAGAETLSIEQYLQAIVGTLLPGESIERREGPDDVDYLVKGSPAPFPLSSFREYLLGLKETIT